MEDDPDRDLDADAERVSKVLGNILTLSINEGFVLAQMEREELFSPPPPSITIDDDSTLRRNIDQLVHQLGGPPPVILIMEGEEPPEYDTYARAAIREALTAFERARMSVLRTRLYLIGAEFMRANPEAMNLPPEPLRTAIIDDVADRYWEHAETSFIRLASYWDRLGQVLDFAFFNIRQYEREGFASVITKIMRNAAAVSEQLRGSASWKRLQAFVKTSDTDGLNWLLQRRNLVIHSLHLGPADVENQNPIFRSAYNHLDVKGREQLRVGTPAEELAILHAHVTRAVDLFRDVIDVGLLVPPSGPRD